MGGQGAVFLAESPTGMRVAIKLLHERFAADPDDRRRFLREAQVAATVAPFCTARVVGTGLFREQPYIVSEYIPGPSLLQLVRTEGPRTGGGLHRLAISTLTALASIHRAGIVHRDFKPGNVILGPEGPVVIDFGIARAMGVMATATQVSGTPAFMSPELLDDQPATPASDIFSWGVTMAYAATGRVPFSGGSIPATFNAILHAEPDLTGVPEPLRTLIAACLAKNPANRPSADHVLRELTNAQRLPDAPADLPGHPPAADRPGPPALGTPGDTVPPSLSQAPTQAGIRNTLARLRRERRTLLIAGSVLAAATGSAGVVALPALFGGRDRRLSEQQGANAAPAFSAPSQPMLDLRAYPTGDAADDFADAPQAEYERHQPEQGEALPNTKVEGGRFVAEGLTPWYGWFVVPGNPPSSGDTVSVLTLGAFAETGKTEDSVFAGRIRDSGNYVGAWYNNTRKEIGIDLRVAGQLTVGSGGVKQALQPGDQLALMVSNAGTIRAYARTGGTWHLVKTVDAAIPGSEQERGQWRHGFAIRGTVGTISVDAFEGRSR